MGPAPLAADFSPVIPLPRLSADETDDLVHEKRGNFYIIAMGYKDGFALLISRLRGNSVSDHTASAQAARRNV
jgi:hypothetical protein